MAEYEYQKTLDVTRQNGLDITWHHMPAKDVERNLQVIKGAYTVLKKTYGNKASLTLKPFFARLLVATKDPNNEDEVFFLECIGCGLMAATRWGGP